MIKEPKWLKKEAVLSMHDRLLSRHGGSSGVRDHGLLETALARPQQLFAYDNPTIFDMAAAYLFGICKNHPFIDGNKRSAFTTAATFLYINGYHLQAPEVDAVLATLATAAGEMPEEKLAEWFKKFCNKV